MIRTGTMELRSGRWDGFASAIVDEATGGVIGHLLRFVDPVDPRHTMDRRLGPVPTNSITRAELMRHLT
jgi:hypothetical protein